MSSTPTAFHLPLNLPGVRVVSSFDELVSTRFRDGMNALCWPRTLSGDYEEVVKHVVGDDDMTSLDDSTLATLASIPSCSESVNTMIEDLRRLRDAGLSPVLDCIRSYPRDDDQELVPTDVYSWHADRATGEADTYLCTYAGAQSEGLRNEDARRCVEVPELRAALLKRFGGEDNAEFEEFLTEHCYDLHYVEVPGAQAFSFGLGNLWRIAVDYPGRPVPPCIHRAPTTGPKDGPRLLLIS